MVRTVTPMARKTKPNSEKLSSGRQIGLRISGQLDKDIAECSEALGLDDSNFIRMVLIENMGKYKRRAKAINEGEESED